MDGSRNARADWFRGFGGADVRTQSQPMVQKNQMIPRKRPDSLTLLTLWPRGGHGCAHRIWGPKQSQEESGVSRRDSNVHPGCSGGEERGRRLDSSPPGKIHSSYCTAYSSAVRCTARRRRHAVKPNRQSMYEFCCAPGPPLGTDPSCQRSRRTRGTTARQRFRAVAAATALIATAIATAVSPVGEVPA